MKLSFSSKTYVIGLLLLAFLSVPIADAYGQRRTGSNSYSVNTSKNNGKSTIHVKDNGKDFKIEYEGEITVSDDDTDVIAISDGGFIEITKSSFGSRRRIVIEADRSGNLDRRYYVGRSEKSYNPDGKAWLAEILPDVVRHTTIAAKSRVDRFYARGGANAVLNEIDELESDYVKAAYFKLLLENNLSNSELVSVIREAGNSINSDYYLANILESNQKAFLSSSQTHRCIY